MLAVKKATTFHRNEYVGFIVYLCFYCVLGLNLASRLLSMLVSLRWLL